MTLTLPRELEEFVSKEVNAGGFPNASALVVEALREFQARKEEEESQNGGCPSDLKALLLEAVRGPHHPLPEDYFEQLRKRVRRTPAQ
jgi:Arc/MetJ-type ribon-helix-helix transcriptional regulator